MKTDRRTKPFSSNFNEDQFKYDPRGSEKFWKDVEKEEATKGDNEKYKKQVFDEFDEFF